MSMFLEFNLTFTWVITPLELSFAIHHCKKADIARTIGKDAEDIVRKDM